MDVTKEWLVEQINKVEELRNFWGEQVREAEDELSLAERRYYDYDEELEELKAELESLEEENE